MPLLILSGPPCTGKTSFAHTLVAFLESSGCLVSLVHADCADRVAAFASAASEKAGRAQLKSAVERLLTQDRVVIVDALNYIKGFRYELYCVVRAVGTTHCVVWVDAPLVEARARNVARAAGVGGSGGHAGEAAAEGGAYEARTLEELWLRFEPPDPRNRWDAPMLRVDGSGGEGAAGGAGLCSSDASEQSAAVGTAAARMRAPAFTSKWGGGGVVESDGRVTEAAVAAAVREVPPAPIVRRSAFRRAAVAPEAQPLGGCADGAAELVGGAADAAHGRQRGAGTEGGSLQTAVVPVTAALAGDAGGNAASMGSAAAAAESADGTGAEDGLAGVGDLLGADAAEDLENSVAAAALSDASRWRATAAGQAVGGAGHAASLSRRPVVLPEAASAWLRALPPAAVARGWATALLAVHSALLGRSGYIAPAAVRSEAQARATVLAFADAAV